MTLVLAGLRCLEHDRLRPMFLAGLRCSHRCLAVRARQEERLDSKVDGVPRFSHLGIDKEKGVDTPGVGSYDVSRATRTRSLDRQRVTPDT